MTSWDQLKWDDRTRLLRLYGDSKKIDKEAKKLGIEVDSLKRSLRRHRKKLTEGRYIEATKTEFKNENRITYTGYEVVKADDAILISDVEIPDVDVSVLQLAMLLGIQHNIKRLIIAGDFVATDQQTLNAWVSTMVDESDWTYNRTLNWSKRILKQFLEWFTEISIIEGNHDDRIARKTGGEVHLGMFLEDMDHVIYSQYSYMYLVTCRRIFYICHPQNFSKHPSTLGKALYNTHHLKGKKHDVVLAHTHLLEEASSEDGLCRIHSLGCTRDPNKTRYKKKASNKHSEWVQGVAMIRAGYFYNYPVKDTDWGFVLGDLAPEWYLKLA